MNEALKPEANDYQNFNDFFTRELKPESRIITANAQKVLSPVDGTISQFGRIQAGQIVQAKGHSYSVHELLAGEAKVAQTFEHGHFMTLYLSPKDYHRIHMPTVGRVKQMWYVPGKLFSVNPATTEHLPGLFAKNERVVCLFETPKGPMLMVLVGAMIVASIETSWAGLIAPNRPKQIKTWQYNEEHLIDLQQGEEMGRFKLGSTVILLYPETQRLKWEAALQAGASVKLGMPLADC